MRIKKVCLLLLTFSIILSFPVISVAQVDSTTLLKLTEFTQAANDDPTLGAIHWISSILQESNSRYYEGMSVPQRLIFNGISSTPGDTHALTMSVDATKGGIHAYDFLTSWDNAIPAADSIAPGQNLLIDLFSDRCDPEFWSSTQAICNYIHSLGLYDEADLEVLDMGSVGGDNVQQRVDNYDTYFGISRTIKIWGNQAVSSASITFDGYTGNVDNKTANYTLHWTSASDTVIIEMAGHLAVGVDPLEAGIGYGEGKGAADISGGPYHFELSYLDGSSIGSQDNQIKGADILQTNVECEVIPASDSICNGLDATFIDYSSGGTPPYSWVWTKPPDPTVLSTDSILTISNATLSDSGQYQVVVTDSNSLADTCYVYLTVHPQPVCSITGDSVVCEGFTTDFCATPGMAGYSWSGPGAFSANTQCTGQIGVAGYYQVIITDSSGCVDTCGRTLVVNSQPVCSITGDSAVCEGFTTDFCATPGMASYSWSGPGAFSANTQCTGQIGVAGYYQVIITDSSGCADTCGRTLVVNSQPVCSITGDSVVCEGSTTDFCAAAGMTSYSWSGPGAFSANTQCTGQIGVAGYYQVIITDSNGCIDSCGRTLVVNPSPVVTAPDTVEFNLCDTGTVCIDITLYDIDELVILVNPPGQFNPSDSTVCFFADRDTIYPFAIIATDTCGNSDTAYTIAVVNFNEPPDVNSPDTAEYFLDVPSTCCFDISLADLDDPSAVTVNPPGQYNPSDSTICFFGDRDTTYHFTIIVADECETIESPLGGGLLYTLADTSYTVAIVHFNDTPVITAPDTVKFNLCDTGTVCFDIILYDPDDGLTVSVNPPGQYNPSDSSICFFADRDTTYNFTIIATDTGGKADTAYTTAIINSNDPPEVTAPDTVKSHICDTATVCFDIILYDVDDGLNVTVNPPGQYNPSDSSICFFADRDTTYDFTIIVTDTCEAADTAYTKAVIDITLPELICSGDTLTCDSTLASAKVTSDPSSGVSYFWTPAPVSGQGTAHARYDAPGSKKVVVTIDATGCKDSCEAVITENVTKPVLSCTGDELTCDSLLASAKVTSNPSVGVSYFWTPAPVSGQGTAHARYNTPGTKKVVVTIDATNCRDSCQAVITEDVTKPDCFITGDNVISEEEPTTEFCATPGMVSYYWSGPPGFVDPGTQCTGQISILGLYTVTITDAYGCTNTCSRTLMKEKEASSMTPVGLTLFLLAVAGFLGYIIFRRRRAAE